MDAFAVAIVTGLMVCPLTKRHVFRLAFHFGLFQGLMPAIGWHAGNLVHKHIAAFDHWIAFGLLVFVGGRMVLGALQPSEEATQPADPTAGMSLVMLSVATSIDALAVGLSLAMIGSAILMPALVIAVVAAGFTTAGMLLGRRIGSRWGSRVETAGGIILIAIGIKILIEHMVM